MVCCDYADPFVSDDGLKCRSCQQALVPASTGAALDLDWLEQQIREFGLSSEPARSFAERIATRLAEQEGEGR